MHRILHGHALPLGNCNWIDTFKMMALRYPQLAELRELRKTLAEMRKIKLTVGRDGRNRTLLSPFQSKTGRNQPSTTRFIFGLPA